MTERPFTPNPKPVSTPKPEDIFARQVRARSKKRQAITPERQAFVAEMIRQRPTCEFTAGYRCTQPSVDVHEWRRRSQGSPIVPSQGLIPELVRVLCRVHHDLITNEPFVGAALGYSELPKKGWIL